MMKQKSRNPLLLLALLLLAALLFTGCGQDEADEETETSQADQQEPSSVEFFAMDTYMTLSAYGDDAQAVLEKGQSLITSLEDKLSAEKKGSQIAKLNKNRKADVDEDVSFLLRKAKKLYRDTDGVFNISVYPLMKAWGFTSKDYRIPSQQTIERLIGKMDLSKLSVSEDHERAEILQKGLQVDLGGIAKGYASSETVKLFRDNGIKSALVNLGGNVQALGGKPDGSPWRVAVQSPYEDDDFLGILEIEDKAAITSGGYERNFTRNGKTYHHIMDPSTGYPADNGLISVTIVSEDGTLADGLSTALYIMGREKAIEYWRAHSDEFDAVLMDENNELYVTAGLKDSFTSDTYRINDVK